MAPAAGPGWEEPTSQPFPKFLSGSDYVFTLCSKGSAYDSLRSFSSQAIIVAPRRHVQWRVVWHPREPSHLASVDAISRYGVITGSFIMLWRGALPNQRSIAIADLRISRLWQSQSFFLSLPSADPWRSGALTAAARPENATSASHRVTAKAARRKRAAADGQRNPQRASPVRLPTALPCRAIRQRSITQRGLRRYKPILSSALLRSYPNF